MSTILKALRRLEEDGAKQTDDAVTRAPTKTALHASRIFAEEAVAETASPETAPRISLGPRGMLAVMIALGLLFLSLGTNWVLRFGADGDELARAKALPTSRVADSAFTEDARAPRGRVAADRASKVQPDGLPDSTSIAAPIAAVGAQNAASKPESVDTASEHVGNFADAAPAQIQTIRSDAIRSKASRAETSKAEPAKPSASSLRPSRVEAARENSLGVAAALPPAAADRRVRAPRPSPDPLSLAKTALTPVKEPEPASRPRPKPTLRAVSPSPVSARRVQQAPEAPADAEELVRKDWRSESLPRETTVVERIDHRGLPDVVVLRTTWHPTPTRRSARIRLEATGEIVTLREGDAISGLVLQKISPSSVLFQAGEVELRRRVGAQR